MFHAGHAGAALPYHLLQTADNGVEPGLFGISVPRYVVELCLQVGRLPLSGTELSLNVFRRSGIITQSRGHQLASLGPYYLQLCDMILQC